MKNISFNFKDIQTRFRQNIGMSLWAGLIILLLLEGFLVVRESAATVLAARHVEPPLQTQLARINFGLYDSIAKRFDAVASFQPSPVTVTNPFGVLEAPAAPPKK